MYRGIAPSELSRAPTVVARHARIWTNAYYACRRQFSKTANLEAGHWNLRGNKQNRNKELAKRRQYEDARERGDPQALGDTPWYRFTPSERAAGAAFRAGPAGLSLEELDSSDSKNPGRFNVDVQGSREQGWDSPSRPRPQTSLFGSDQSASLDNGGSDQSASTDTGRSWMSTSSTARSWNKPPRLHSYIAKEDPEVWQPKGPMHNYSALDGELDSPGGENPFGTPMTVLRKEPRLLPRMTPTSEFLYGYNMCLLAFRQMRRQIHKLHIYTGLMRQGGSRERENLLRKIAENVKVPVSTTMDVRLIDAMSKGRPHNGFALEVEPIELPRIGYLTQVSEGKCNAPITQSTGYVEIKSKGERQNPFVLILDELCDGGNFGAILRTAYYLGVDAVLSVSNNSAPPTALMSRASAGALEAIDMYNVSDLAAFITKSKRNGWTFYGAMPSPSNRELANTRTKKSIKWYDIEGINDPLHFGPVALVMGNESEGLRPTIQRLMDCYATITKLKSADPAVDSLNVGVAASILCHAFLRPVNKEKKPEKLLDNRAAKRLGARHEWEMETLRETNVMFHVQDGKYERPNTAPPEQNTSRAGVGSTMDPDQDADYDDEGSEFEDYEEANQDITSSSGAGSEVTKKSDRLNQEHLMRDGPNEVVEKKAGDASTAIEGEPFDDDADMSEDDDSDWDEYDDDEELEHDNGESETDEQGVNLEGIQNIKSTASGLSADNGGVTAQPKPKKAKKPKPPVLTKKQRKQLKKERKKEGIRLRKKVRDEKARTTAELNMRKDPTILMVHRDPKTTTGPAEEKPEKTKMGTDAEGWPAV
ncbi:hypothetical protein Dda_5794 [Drechslerella dactyloides]|uniref:rRNA methyltransferase 1, mitochondrial n=1 Tax=Drechslerella dactyloides TaxID=74499 RepID=A0AAD6IUF9_DREDA|nr:hypothetical protein Dda_5794 [Drechslerella dactyloides]